MIYSLVSLMNAVTWLVCIISISADASSFLHSVDHILLISCILLNIILLLKKKYGRVREKINLIIYTILAISFLACDIYYENVALSFSQLVWVGS